MRSPDGRTVTLLDLERIAAGCLDTFHIPSREMRERLRPGDLVKLHFRNDEGHVERMWVETRAVGVLAYLPSASRRLRHGDLIRELLHRPVVDVFQ